MAEQIVELAAAETRRAGTARRLSGSPPQRQPRREGPPPRLFIGTPSYDGKVRCDYAASLVRTFLGLDREGIDVTWMPLERNSLLPWARNQLVAEFLGRETCTHMLMADADIAWTPADVLRLLAVDADLALGLCPTRGDIQEDVVGTGFLLARREVFLRLLEAGVAPRITRSSGMPQPLSPAAVPWFAEFFKVALDEGGVYRGEDDNFLRAWRSIGGRVAVHPGVQLVHAGRRCTRRAAAETAFTPHAAA